MSEEDTDTAKFYPQAKDIIIKHIGYFDPNRFWFKTTVINIAVDLSCRSAGVVTEEYTERQIKHILEYGPKVAKLSPGVMSNHNILAKTLKNSTFYIVKLNKAKC